MTGDAFHDMLLDIDRRFQRSTGMAATEHGDPGGADMRGYSVWWLPDNFGWGEGYSQRFGIVYVDHATSAAFPTRLRGGMRTRLRRAGFPTIRPGRTTGRKTEE